MLISVNTTTTTKTSTTTFNVNYNYILKTIKTNIDAPEMNVQFLNIEFPDSRLTE